MIGHILPWVAILAAVYGACWYLCGVLAAELADRRNTNDRVRSSRPLDPALERYEAEMGDDRE